MESIEARTDQKMASYWYNIHFITEALYFGGGDGDPAANSENQDETYPKSYKPNKPVRAGAGDGTGGAAICACGA